VEAQAASPLAVVSVVPSLPFSCAPTIMIIVLFDATLGRAPPSVHLPVPPHCPLAVPLPTPLDDDEVRI